MTPDARILTGCSVLPPAHKNNGSKTASTANTAATTTAKRKTAGRFATINAFVDCGMDGLRPVEQVVWFALWRGIPLLKLQAETGVDRGSLSRFIHGERSLRLDIADKLAVYFKLHLVERED